MSGAESCRSQYEPLGIHGASLDGGRSHYVLRLDTSYRFLSSAPLGEGFLDSRWVMSLQVTPDAEIPCPQRYLKKRAAGFGVPTEEPLIGLLTAVHHDDAQVCVRSEAGMTVAALATVGLSNASGPGHKDISHLGDPSPGAPARPTPGTINLVILIDADLSPGALARASTIVAEAKALALFEAGVVTSGGHAATGTSTDASVVGHSGRGPHFDYAGSSTLAGWMAAATAYEAVGRGIQAYHRSQS